MMGEYVNIAKEDAEFLKEFGDLLGFPVYYRKDSRRTINPRVGFDLESGSPNKKNNHIISIGCYREEFDHYPSSICNLKKLKKIEIRWAPKVIEFPSIFRNIPQLQTLSLSYLDKLTTIPSWIDCLSQLETLEIITSNISSIPKEICNLSRLKTLKLWGNKIEKLPDEIGNMVSLEILDVRGNKLTQLPISLNKNPNLWSIFAKGNPIQDFPWQLGERVRTDVELDIDHLKKEDLDLIKTTINVNYGEYKWTFAKDLVKKEWERRKPELLKKLNQ